MIDLCDSAQILSGTAHTLCWVANLEAETTHSGIANTIYRLFYYYTYPWGTKNISSSLHNLSCLACTARRLWEHFS